MLRFFPRPINCRVLVYGAPGVQRVLIADDNTLVLRMIEKLLSGAGFEVTTARDGMEAVEKVFADPVDLVVLDVNMPRMNGYQTCRLLKNEEATKHIPVVILTGNDQAGDRFWGLEIGADRYVTKGAEPQKILQVLKEVMAEAAKRTKGGPRERPKASADVLARVNDLLDRQLYEMTILSEIGRVTRSVSELDQTFTSVMTLVTRAADYTIGAMAFVDGEELEILIALQRPCATQVVDAFKAKLLEAVAHEWKGAPFTRVRARVFTPKVGDPDEKELQGFTAFPIPTGDSLRGMVALAGKTMARTAAENRAFLETVANQAHIVTESSRMLQRLAHLAAHDSLTEVVNRRYLEEMLRKECDRVGRYAGGLSLLIIDVDHFKNVNDERGHLAGDLVLRDVARVLKDGIRTVDTLGRYGGEEFMAILPQTEIDDARLLAERLRSAVETHAFKLSGKPLSITVSIGVAHYPEESIASAEDLVRASDQALYRAKQAGRNRIG